MLPNHLEERTGVSSSMVLIHIDVVHATYSLNFIVYWEFGAVRTRALTRFGKRELPAPRDNCPGIDASSIISGGNSSGNPM